MISLATAAFAFSGRQLADDDHDGHDHGGGSAAPAAGCTVAYEWGGIFAMPSAAGTYSYTVYKKDGAWAEPSMKVVFLPVTDTSQATLNAQIEVAHEAFEHHCGADELVDVEPGQTIIPGDHRCSKLHIEGDAASIQYTIRLTDAKNAAVTNLAIFTEHNPSEFEIADGHYLTSSVTGGGEAGSGATDALDVEPVGATLGAADPECPSPAAPPAAPPKGDDNPCFSESATACRLDDSSLAPATAYAQCFGAADGGAAARVSMRALKAGDIVLASPTATTRVIVNQHAAVRLSSAVLEIEHAGGVNTGRLALTPDHVLWVDGAFRAAAEVREGSQLAPQSEVTRVRAATHAVVNPLTTSGTILAAGPTGAPVVSSTFPEWIAHLLLGAALPYPLPLSGAGAASYLFPASVQAYYDALLEPIFSSTASGLKELKAAVPAPAALVILLGLDAALVAGFALWSLGLKGMVALLAVGLVAKARRAKA